MISAVGAGQPDSDASDAEVADWFRKKPANSAGDGKIGDLQQGSQIPGAVTAAISEQSPVKADSSVKAPVTAAISEQSPVKADSSVKAPVTAAISEQSPVKTDSSVKAPVTGSLLWDQLQAEIPYSVCAIPDENTQRYPSADTVINAPSAEATIVDEAAAEAPGTSYESKIESKRNELVQASVVATLMTSLEAKNSVQRRELGC